MELKPKRTINYSSDLATIFSYSEILGTDKTQNQARLGERHWASGAEYPPTAGSSPEGCPKLRLVRVLVCEAPRWNLGVLLEGRKLSKLKLSFVALFLMTKRSEVGDTGVAREGRNI